jgi:hypothetical protein
MNNNWSFKQKISFRISTMLLCFVVLLIIISNSFLLVDLFSTYLPMWRFYQSVSSYVLISGIIAFVYLVASIWNKRPQVQYLVEILVCLIIFNLVRFVVDS